MAYTFDCTRLVIRDDHGFSRFSHQFQCDVLHFLVWTIEDDVAELIVQILQELSVQTWISSKSLEKKGKIFEYLDSVYWINLCNYGKKNSRIPNDLKSMITMSFDRLANSLMSLSTVISGLNKIPSLISQNLSWSIVFFSSYLQSWNWTNECLDS